jgi:cell division protein FtsI/penicillin-binding protein 2
MSDDGSITPKTPQVVRKDVISPKASATLRNMVYQSRQQGVTGGQDRKGYIVGGKTGTAQTIDPATGKYRESNATGTYLGFGGNKTPRYVIMVYVKDSKLPGYAGNQAANPIFTDISNWLLDYLKIQPVGH